MLGVALRAILPRLRAALRDRRGTAAVEFALILPVMLLMYVGASDVTRGVMASRDVDILSRTISDLVAQQPSNSAIPTATLAQIFTTSSAIMAPFSTTSLKLTVTAIDITAKSDKSCCDAKVRWTYYSPSGTGGATPRACGTLTQTDPGQAQTASTMPKAIVTANDQAGAGYTTGNTTYLIIADVSYQYTPFFPQAAGYFSTLTKTTFMVPRSNQGPITLASPLSPASGQNGTICF